MTALARFLAIASLTLLAACGGVVQVEPVQSPANGWRLNAVAVEYGPAIRPTDFGDDFDSAFVWAGDGDGDRRTQVETIFREAMLATASTVLLGTRPVDVTFNIRRFHALIWPHRLLCCGLNSIFADITVSDAETGAQLAYAENVDMSRVAVGGMPALVTGLIGRTERWRITQRIADRTAEFLQTL